MKTLLRLPSTRQPETTCSHVVQKSAEPQAHLGAVSLAVGGEVIGDTGLGERNYNARIRGVSVDEGVVDCGCRTKLLQLRRPPEVPRFRLALLINRDTNGTDPLIYYSISDERQQMCATGHMAPAQEKGYAKR